MKHLTLIAAIVCSLLAITELIAFPFIVEASIGAVAVYISLFVLFTLLALFFFEEYIDECKARAFWDGVNYGRETLDKH